MTSPHAFIQPVSTLILLLAAMAFNSSAAAVKVERAPGDGLQPQSVVDASGVVHLLYFKGDPKAGDVFYTRRKAGSETWESALRVNSQPGSAIAVGTIRGGHLAVGRAGRVHVAWNGSGQASPKYAGGSPMLYARLNDTGTSFEPQRNLMTQTKHLDGGGSVAADNAGHVYVVFHASPPDGKDESTRAVYVARSDDDGRTFAPEARANSEPTGACACCGLRAFAPADGALHISYRLAREKVNRDMALLSSKDAGASFSMVTLGQWKGTTCPMSSTALAADATRLHTTWEIGTQVYLGGIDLATGGPFPPVSPPGTGKRKHPTLALNSNGETLLAWTEGTGWNKGGTLAWQLFDRSHRPVGPGGRAPNVPVWGLATAFATAGGDFVIVY